MFSLHTNDTVLGLPPADAVSHMRQMFFDNPGAPRVFKRARQRHRVRIGCVKCAAKNVPCACSKADGARGFQFLSTARTKPDKRTSAMLDDEPFSDCSLVAVRPSGDTVDEIAAVVDDLNVAQLSFNDPSPRWRERHNFHFFINYTAPQLSGNYSSAFWQKFVIQAAYHHQSVLHALVGLGSLHEGIMHAESHTQLQNSVQYLAALQHLNKSISALSQGQLGSTEKPDARLLLTLCILFTTFDAFQGRTSDALTHATQGSRLLKARQQETDMSVVRKPFPIPVDAVAPMVALFNYTTAIYTSAHAEVLVDSRVELPPLFSSIDDAQNFIHCAKNAITTLSVRIWQHPEQDQRIAAAAEILTYTPWLHKWKHAFDNFVNKHRKRFNDFDVKRILILEANYLFSVTASVSNHAGQTPPYEAGWQLFPQMLDVCEAVIRISGPEQPTVSNTRGRYLSYGLWLHEPLFILKTFSIDSRIRERASTIFETTRFPDSIAHSGSYISPDAITDVKPISDDPTPVVDDDAGKAIDPIRFPAEFLDKYFQTGVPELRQP